MIPEDPIDQLHGHEPAREAAWRLLATQFRIIRDNARAMRRGHDPEALHDFRVAIRRFRAFLRLFAKELVPDSDRIALDRDLAAFTKLFGDLRDQDVWIIILKHIMEQEKVADAPHWRHYLGRQEQHAADIRRQAAPAFPGHQWDSLLKRLEQFLNSNRPNHRQPSTESDFGGQGDRRTSASAVRGAPTTHRCRATESQSDVSGGSSQSVRKKEKPCRRIFSKRIHRALRRLQPGPKEILNASPEELHALRRKYRRLRYWAEGTGHIFGPAGAMLARRLKSVADLLGKIHDIDVHLERLRGDEGPVARRLDQLFRHQRQKCLADLTTAVTQIPRQKLT